MAQKYRFVGRHHYHRGDALSEGDIVELSQNEADHFSHKFAPVESSDNGTSDGDTENTAEFNAEAFLSGHDHWREIVSAIEAGDADGYLDAVRDAEQARDTPRDSILSALDARDARDES